METRQTSIDCYNEIKSSGLLSKRRLEVYRAIVKYGPCTTSEALRDYPTSPNGVGSRTTELRDLGVIYEKSVRKCTVSGKNVIEWEVTGNLPVKKEKKLTRSQRKKEVLESIVWLGDKVKKFEMSNEEELTALRSIYKKVQDL